MATYELTKQNDFGGIPKGFKLMVKSNNNPSFNPWPEKEEYLTALEYLPNIDTLKRHPGWGTLVGFNWNGQWSSRIAKW
jgi:hypothetical protein